MAYGRKFKLRRRGEDSSGEFGCCLVFAVIAIAVAVFNGLAAIVRWLWDDTTTDTNRMAAAGFVLSAYVGLVLGLMPLVVTDNVTPITAIMIIVVPLFWPLGLVFSGIGLYRALKYPDNLYGGLKHPDKKGKYLSYGGLAIGALVALLFLGSMLWW